MTPKGKLQIVVLGAIIALLAILFGIHSAEQRPDNVTMSPGRDGVQESGHVDEGTTEDPMRTPAVSPSDGKMVETSTTTAGPAHSHTQGTTIDTDGVAVGSIVVEFTPDQANPTSTSQRATTDNVGSFEFDVSGGGRVAAVDERWSTVCEAIIGSYNPDAPPVLVVAPSIRLQGIVITEDHVPIAGAELACFYRDVRRALNRVMDNCEPKDWRAVTDQNGQFVLGPVPAISKSHVRAEAAGYQPESIDFPLTSQLGMTIVLRRSADADDALRGRVVDALGEGVTRAWVALGSYSVSTDEKGYFTLDRKKSGEGRILRALKSGFLPVQIECAASSPMDKNAWPNPLILTLDAKPLSIVGRILSGRDTPIAGATIRLLDVTPYAVIDTSRSSGIPNYVTSCDTESILSGQLFSNSATSDPTGRFETLGLLPKEYRLRIIDPSTLNLQITKPIAAGTKNLVVRMTNTDSLETITGTVVDFGGAPLPGAMVCLIRRDREDNEDLRSSPLTTDSAGHFEFHDISAQAEWVEAWRPPGHRASQESLRRQGPLDAIVLRVPRMCHMKVDMGQSKVKATQCEVRDAQDRAIEAFVYQGGSSLSYWKCPLVDGISQGLVVPEDASFLVLFQEGTEVGRLTLKLTIGDLNVIRP